MATSVAGETKIATYVIKGYEIAIVPAWFTVQYYYHCHPYYVYKCPLVPSPIPPPFLHDQSSIKQLINSAIDNQFMQSVVNEHNEHN